MMIFTVVETTKFGLDHLTLVYKGDVRLVAMND